MKPMCDEPLKVYWKLDNKESPVDLLGSAHVVSTCAHPHASVKGAPVNRGIPREPHAGRHIEQAFMVILLSHMCEYANIDSSLLAAGSASTCAAQMLFFR